MPPSISGRRTSCWRTSACRAGWLRGAQHIKNTPRLAHIPVVLLTGAFEPIDQARARLPSAATACWRSRSSRSSSSAGVKELLARRGGPGAGAAPAVAPSCLPAPAGETHRLVNEGVPRGARSGVRDADGGRPRARPAIVAAELSQATPSTGSRGRRPPARRSGTCRRAAPVGTPAPAAAAPNPPAPEAFPRLGDAFAALLAAEQVSAAAAAAPLWPAAAPASAPAGDLVDEVTRRVLDQMSDRAVRETVADIVSQVAERLVREEIERIKKSIS